MKRSINTNLNITKFSALGKNVRRHTMRPLRGLSNAHNRKSPLAEYQTGHKKNPTQSIPQNQSLQTKLRPDQIPFVLDLPGQYSISSVRIEATGDSHTVQIFLEHGKYIDEAFQVMCKILPTLETIDSYTAERGKKKTLCVYEARVGGKFPGLAVMFYETYDKGD